MTLYICLDILLGSMKNATFKEKSEVPFLNQYVGEYKDASTQSNWVLTLISESEIYARGKGFQSSYFMSLDYFLQCVQDGTLRRVD